MGKKSTKENKTPYQLRREELGLSREDASQLLEFIPPERILRFENGPSSPQPDEVIQMAEKYKMPSLCNYYCSHECSIGRQYVPEIKIEDLSQIVLKMLASLNSISKEKERKSAPVNSDFGFFPIISCSDHRPDTSCFKLSRINAVFFVTKNRIPPKDDITFPG